MRRTSPFTTIRTEGGLLPADLLARVSALDRDLECIAPDAYHLDPGRRLNEAIAESWNVLSGRWLSFAHAIDDLPVTDRTATTPTREWLLRLFAELGYGRLQPAKAIEVDGKSYPVSHGWGAVPIHLVGARLSLEQRTEGIPGAARSSPHGLVQELLNRSDDRLWAFVSNGLRLRILRDNAALTRQAFVEFDLGAMFVGQAYADFAVLWLLCHESRVEGDPPEKCVLERWSADSAQRGTRALDQLRAGVETAIAELGGGFLRHPANGDIREALRSGHLSPVDYQRQLLRLVYRLLFLLVAEARDLLLVMHDDYPSGVARYRSWYSLDRLREIAELHRGGPHSDLWRQLNVTFSALGQPGGEPRLALPGLGSFLWSQRATPDLDTADISNASLLAAVLALTSTYDGREKVRRPVDYRNLGTEELGSIYESLLELHPDMDLASGSFRLQTVAGNERKTSGSYYTPSSLISELLDSALEPVLDEAVTASDPEAALLGLTVLDPACGSGHFLIAAGHRIARRLASIRGGDTEPGPDAVRSALRDVVGRCLHGIDVNEMAVELCKVSLWIEAVEPGKPLSFLDHHIVCGNSLLGTTPHLLAGGIPDAAFKPLTGDDKATAASLKRSNAVERAGQGTLDFGSPPSHEEMAGGFVAIDAVDDGAWMGVLEKQRRWSAVIHSNTYGRAQLAADAWCSAFVAEKVPGAPRITTALVRQIERIAVDRIDQATLAAVRALADRYRFLHLHLAFPHVFHVLDVVPLDGPGQGWTGGFDVVLGNPPWERVKLQEKEFFAARSPGIATAPNAAARKKLIAGLAQDDEGLLRDFQHAVRDAEGESHLLRSSGRFPLCGRGDINTYAVFAELMRDSGSLGGRIGVIVPSGIATDDTTKHFFASLVDSRSLVSLYEFENQGYFAGVGQGHMVRFCLLTVEGRSRGRETVDMMFRGTSIADLTDPERRVSLTVGDLRLLNPNSRTAPVFTTRRDARLATSVYKRFPVLVEDGPPQVSPWHVQFLTLFHMANDSTVFRTRAQLESDGWILAGNIFRKADEASYVPLYEAKMFGIYDHRAGSFDGTSARPHQLPEPRVEAKTDPTSTAMPWYWVPSSHLSGERPWLLVWRDVTDSRASARTCIFSAIPSVGVAHTAPLVDSKRAHLLLALFSSVPFDWLARQKVAGLHLTYSYLKQLPTLPPKTLDAAAPWCVPETTAQWLTPRVVELTYTAWDLEPFANDIGWFGPPFRWDEWRRTIMRAELDACFFHLYGLQRDDVDYVLAAFPIVNRRDRQKYGEERTRRLILERYDALAEAMATGTPYETVLDPPPADPSVAHPESTRPDWAVRVTQSPR